MEGSKPWNEFLINQLGDSEEFSVEYLNAALGENDPSLLLQALRQVAEARGGIGDLAKKSGLNRESLYRMLSENGNPTIYSLNEVLDALGMQIQFAPKKAA
jgi:probable addiction module antidote protein